MTKRPVSQCLNQPNNQPLSHRRRFNGKASQAQLQRTTADTVGLEESIALGGGQKRQLRGENNRLHHLQARYQLVTQAEHAVLDV
eukprot:7674849-Pyramimonas_sp.AAC.1